VIYSINLEDNSETELRMEDLKYLRLENSWLEIMDPTREELEAISEISGIPVDLMEIPVNGESVNMRMEPEFGIINFAVVSEIIESREIHPIIIVFSKNFLITVEKKEYKRIIDLAKVRMHKTKVDPPSLVAYYVLDEMVSHNFSHLEKIEERTANLEEEILEKTDVATIKRVFRLKSRLISFNKILWYERGLIFNLKTSGATCVSTKARSLFDTTHEYLTRQIDIVETYREIMGDAINAYLSTVSNRINASIRGLTVVIFYLTIITTVTAFPNTVATFFGISQFGNTSYLIIFAVLILSIVLPSIWLWRKKWLRLRD